MLNRRNVVVLSNDLKVMKLIHRLLDTTEGNVIASHMKLLAVVQARAPTIDPALHLCHILPVAIQRVLRPW